MRSELHRYLDGELPRSALPPELAGEAQEWDALAESARLLAAERAPAWLEQRVMAAVEAKRPGWHVRLARWLLEPQPVRVRPAGVALAAAALAVLWLAWPERAERPAAPAGEPAPPGLAATAGPAAPVVYVQFVFAAPSARSVAVAGDFNGWNPDLHLLRDPDGDGVWTGLFAVPAGLHKYMFVVDGERWVTDPRAERYVDDGFGMRNALLSVAPPARRSS